MLTKKLSMNLQYFADPNPDGDGGEPAQSQTAQEAAASFVAGVTQSAESAQSSTASTASSTGSTALSAATSADDKPFKAFATQEELNQFIASRADRAYQKGKSEGKEDGKSEAEKLAGMTEEQKQQAKIDDILAENARLKAAKVRDDMTVNVQNRLAEHGLTLSNDEAQLLVTDDADSTDDNTNKFIKLVDRIVTDEKKKLFKGSTPARGGETQPDPKNFGSEISKQAHSTQRKAPTFFK